MAQDNYSRFRVFFKTATLWNGKLAGLQQFPLSEFDFSHLKEQKDSLELPLIPVNTVLGKRAEYFYEFCIQQSSNYNLIASNIQINVNKITKGELDYLIKEVKTGKVLHVELVYKFYCYDPSVTEKSAYLNEVQNQELSRYVGPNKRDNFVFKFDRLLNHQLPLLYTAAARETLESLKLDIDKIEQRVCFLAHIFIPRELWQHDFKYINKRSIAGYYLNGDAFAKADTNNLYYFPEKYAWKMEAHSLNTFYTHEDAVLIAIKSLERGFAPLIWMRLDDGSFERFFVIA
ncbi:MAG: DUF1853 family protein [Nonlabens sp.]|uniref:DUF1853 family protein n=1 Tax=Nonlabens sp. TaxID=1888209 RepID=UPI003EF2F487